MSKPVVRMCGVTKRFRDFTLGPVDLDLHGGEMTMLSGGNGSGKSTLLRSLVGLLRPDSGSIDVLGRGWPGDAAEAKGAIAFVSEDLQLHPRATLRWHGDLVRGLSRDCTSIRERKGRAITRGHDVASASHSDRSWDETRFLALAARFELSLGARAGTFSRGQTLRALLTLALARRPVLLVLDEATGGLDHAIRAEVRGLLKELAREDRLAVIFTSHLIEDRDELADRVIEMRNGRIASNRRGLQSVLVSSS